CRGDSTPGREAAFRGRAIATRRNGRSGIAAGAARHVERRAPRLGPSTCGDSSAEAATRPPESSPILRRLRNHLPRPNHLATKELTQPVAPFRVGALISFGLGAASGPLHCLYRSGVGCG